MTKMTIKHYRDTTKILTGSDNVVQIGVDGWINVGTPDDCYGIWEQAGGSHNKAVVKGLVWGINASDGRAIYSQGEDFSVRIDAHGTVKGDSGIWAQGADLTVVNKGRIEAYSPGYGIRALETGCDIRNEGVISGWIGISAAGDSKIVNAGKVLGSGIVIGLSASSGDTPLIVNHGLMKSGGYYSIEGSLADETIRNDGRIVGDILLSAGNDVVDTRGGSIVGKVRGGPGNDTLITDKDIHELIETADQGFDTVKSTVSYALTDNVETLVLLGRKNIDATGNNSTDNYLYGNAGNNVLRGLDGYNELFGKGGRDTLIGGADYDLFGLGKGYGRDTVRNFQDGTDQIDIYNVDFREELTRDFH